MCLLRHKAIRSKSCAVGSEMKTATIVYADIYKIKYDLIVNYSKYSFVSPVRTCCGYRGPPYNFNASIKCGAPGCQVCAEGSGYISWDGVNYTEAANAIVVSKKIYLGIIPFVTR